MRGFPFENNSKKYTDMKAKVIMAVFAASFIAAVATVPTLKWYCLIPSAVFVATCLYIGRYGKRYESDLDELFGRDHELR